MVKIVISTNSTASSESLILFKWDGNSENNIEDVDYFIWGGIQGAIDKTGVGNYVGDTQADEQLYFEEVPNDYYAFSRILELDDENLMDAVTAISGSGPAYFYYLIEAMTFSGVSIGLSKQNALKLARETFLGAAALLDKSEEDVVSLREAVTSPGGTTEAALNTFQKNNKYFKLVKKAIISARDRGIDLADQLK